MRTEDGQLIRKCLDGEPEAFGFLVDRYRESVYALAYSRLGNFHNAEDVTQEVFIKAYQSLRSLRRWDSFHAWIYAITSNLCKNWIRARSKQPDREFIEDQDPGILQEHSMDSHSEELLCESVREALHSLPEIHRQVLTLFYLGGMSTKEIARFLGTSPNTIIQRLYAARSRLKEEMLAMMKATFEEQRLPVGFTLRIVETVKWIRIHPLSSNPGLPWGLSIAAGIIIAVLSIGSHLSLSHFFEAPADADPLSEARMTEISEIPVNMLDISQLSSIPGYRGHSSEGMPDLSTQQNAVLMAPKGNGGKIPDEPSVRLGKGSLGGLVYSPDGKILAVSTGLGVRLYDANNLNEIGILQEDKAYLWNISISHDGGILAVLNSLGGISLWDMQTQKLIGSIPDSQGYYMDLSPDGRVIAIRDDFADGKNIHLWDTQSLKLIGLLKGHTDYIRSFAFTPDGKMLASVGYDRTIRLWDIQAKKQIGLLDVDKNPATAVAISPDGKVLVSGSEEGELLLWDIQEQKLIGSLKGHNSWVSSVAFSPDGETMASSSEDQTIRIWNVQGQKLITLIQVNKYDGNQICFSPDGRTIASANLMDQTVRFWDVQEQKQSGIIDGFAMSHFVAFSPDSKTIASGGYVIDFWDVVDQKRIGDGVPTDSSFQRVAFSPDGKILAGACFDSIYLVDTQTQKQIGLLKGHTQHIQSIAFSPDGKLLASGSIDMTLRLWDIQQQKEVWKQNCPSHIHSVAFTPDGKYVASAIGGDGTVRIWDVGTRREIDRFQVPGAAMSIAISSDGKLLACGSRDTVTIWDFDKKTQLGIVSVGDNGLVEYAIFSPDNNWLASTSYDATCHVWDVNTLEELADLKGHKGGIINISFSPDGKWLATSGTDGAILLWEVDIPVEGRSVEPTGKLPGTWGEVKKAELLQNYPNPFNPDTWIPYQLAEDADVTVSIRNVSGQLVRELHLGRRLAGLYVDKAEAAYWDGANEVGEEAASDVYFYTIQAGGFTATRKMVVAR